MGFSTILSILEIKASYRRKIVVRSYLSFYLFCHPLKLCPSSTSAQKQAGLFRGYPPGRAFIPRCVRLWRLLHMKFNGAHMTDVLNNRQPPFPSLKVCCWGRDCGFLLQWLKGKKKKLGHNLNSTPARYSFLNFLTNRVSLWFTVKLLRFPVDPEVKEWLP